MYSYCLSEHCRWTEINMFAWLILHMFLYIYYIKASKVDIIYVWDKFSKVSETGRIKIAYNILEKWIIGSLILDAPNLDSKSKVCCIYHYEYEVLIACKLWQMIAAVKKCPFQGLKNLQTTMISGSSPIAPLQGCTIGHYLSSPGKPSRLYTLLNSSYPPILFLIHFMSFLMVPCSRVFQDYYMRVWTAKLLLTMQLTNTSLSIRKVSKFP